MTRLRRFFVNGIIMTATSLVMSSIGVWFSVYISNRIGSEAMGTYQLIMSVYSFATTLATSGISFATTRLVSEEMGSSHLGGVIKSVKKCVAYALVFSLVAGVVLFFLAKPIGEKVLSNADTVIPTRSPRYAFAAPKMTARSTPIMMDVIVNSGVMRSAGTYGLNSF